MRKQQVYRKIMSSVAVILICISMHAQVYNYDPIRHSNFETNPAYLSSDRYRQTASYIHQGNVFFSGKFAYDALKYAVYKPRYFTGLGLVINNTTINDSTGYSYAGAGIAYRTVLFNKICARIGILYKCNIIHSSSGSFGYYNFKSSGEEGSRQRTLQNANLSVSFSSFSERFFVSASLLNASLFRQQSFDKSLFPQYYVVSIGDLAKIIHGDPGSNKELYYTGFIKQYAGQKTVSVSHYINGVNVLAITRYSSLRYGLRAGYADNSNIQCTPMISYYMRSGKNKFWNFQVLYDFAIPLSNHQQVFKPSLQINLTHLF